MFKSLLSFFFRPSRIDAVRPTYGFEPYRAPADVPLTERIIAVLDGSAKFLLRDVIGFQAISSLPNELIPSRFKSELPVTAEQVRNFVKENGLPKGALSWDIEIQEAAGLWKLVIYDIRDANTVGTFPSKRDAELNALQYLSNINPYIIGAIK
ncbi:hypothetical protein Undi14_09770 [Undibacterium sp. 14-3-2]|uniref:hypothetical protein n=1 Tax=Undibacterium sp. 14-3-2 TaxID=2800129 RepID=UPI0019056E38|nr:hypothetical protein [Undibacterium sp. 14-3-2]MBK1890329.1 hypothetical protein [Undibacterium sp. 14-3-2]